jgi:mRNA-degrading endonuclease RelE of RelBE toxin-antitoxin system
MNVLHSPRFLKQYRDAPFKVQKAFDKQVQLLCQIYAIHRSKLRNTMRLATWRARVTLTWRFYFTIEAHTYHIHTLIPHPK